MLFEADYAKNYASIMYQCLLKNITYFRKISSKSMVTAHFHKTCTIRTQSEVRIIPAWLRNFAFFEARAYCSVNRNIVN